MTRKLFTFLLFLALISVSFLWIKNVDAQGIDVGINQISNNINLSNTNPITIAARIINVVLLFLGVIVVGLVIYAGFVWMTSGGDEEKIGQAKKILGNAVIGLIIILSAWGIATFVLNRLLSATNGGNNSLGFNNNVGATLGTGAIGACTIERVYPEQGQQDVARNTSIMVTFKEGVRLNSFCQDGDAQPCACGDAGCNLINLKNIRIFRQEAGDGCSSDACSASSNNAKAYVKASGDRKTFIITPIDFLGAADGQSDYVVKMTGGILKDDGDSIFKTCSTDYLQWGFSVSNSLDLTPPQVRQGGIFPLPDNNRDLWRASEAAVAASALITVNSCPNTYRAAEIIDVEAANTSPSATAVISPDYSENFNSLQVVSTPDNSQAQLYFGSDLLGVANWQDNKVNFNGFFELNASNHAAGNSWVVTLKPAVLADKLMLGSEVYNFATDSVGNNILVTPGCDAETAASSIQIKLSGHPDIEVNRSGKTVVVQAKVAGAAGNNLNISSNNTESLSVSRFSGGKDLVVRSEIKDRHDRPMNSVIQINFNEAVNPLLVSGSANAVSNYIRVVNAEAAAKAGDGCNQNSDCASYRCNNQICVGDYLAGDFLIANSYKTVEFISDVECGKNGCGEKIYCLPANSHLAVELVAANLKSCTTDADCSAFQPFTKCSPFLAYKTCQDASNKNYPVANLSELDGVVDASLNSLDGNRDIFADGPISFYNENLATSTNLKDKYKWSFYINDQIVSESPRINYIKPENSSQGADLNAPVQVNFNNLMMNSSLRTGSTWINNGQENIEHHLLNIFSVTPSPLGYWVTADNRDIDPLDGEPDKTFVTIGHTKMNSSVTYKTQAGSGIKDIYQNCFKPSAGLSCNADEGNPSCCNGVATSTLSAEGNCQ